MEKINNKILSIFLNSIPSIIMILLVPLVSNDYWLLTLFVLIGIVALVIKYEKNDYIYLLFGLFVIIIFETLFVSTGVETFERNSLFGIMPLWLPVLWAYSFLAIKRSVVVIDR